MEQRRMKPFKISFEFESYDDGSKVDVKEIEVEDEK